MTFYYKSIRAVVLLAVMLLCVGLLTQQAWAKDPRITVQDARARALEYYPAIQNIEETIKQADLLVASAWTMLLPNLSAHGNYTINSSAGEIAFPDFQDPAAIQVLTTGQGDLPMITTTVQEETSYLFGFSANMPIFNARSIPLIGKANKYQDYTAYDGRHQKNALLFSVSASYYNAYSAQRMLQVAQENRDNAERFRALSQARLDVGSATRIDLLRADIQLKEAEKQLANAKDSLKLAKTGLSYLIGVTGDFELVEPEAIAGISGATSDLIAQALTDRLDLKASKLYMEMAKDDQAETWMKWVPMFDVTFNWNYNSATGFTNEHDSWSVIFGAKWNLLEGGSKIIEVFDRKSKTRVAQNNAQQLTLSIKEEVEKNHLQWQQHRRNLAIADEQVELAAESYRLVNRQYETGLATSLDVLDASTQLTSAKLNRVVERLQTDLSMLALNQSVGAYLQ